MRRRVSASGGFGLGFGGEHFPFALLVFFGDDGAHGALGDLALYPGDEVEVGEGAGFVPVAFEGADLFEEFFKFGAQAGPGGMEGGAEEFEHFFFDAGEAFAFGHEAVDGFGQGLHEVEVAEFVVGHEVEDPGVALKVVAEVELVVDDALQVVDAGVEVAGAEIEGCDLIVEDQDAVAVDEEVVLRELLFDLRDHWKHFFEVAEHEDLVDLGGGDIDEALDAEVVVFHYAFGPCEGLEFPQGYLELAVVAQVEVGVEEVVEGLDVVSSLYADHEGLFLEEVEPFLGVAVVHQEVLTDEGVPVVALVEIEAFVEAGLLPGVGGHLFPEVFADEGLVFFVAGVAILDIPAIDEQGHVGEACDHVDAVDDLAGFGRQLFCAHLHAVGDVEGLDPFLERDYLYQKVEFLVGFCGFFGAVEEAEALLEETFFIEDMCVVEKFVELQVDAIRAFQEAEAGEYLFVEMGFEVTELGFFDAGEFFQETFFVVVAEFVEGVE